MVKKYFYKIIITVVSLFGMILSSHTAFAADISVVSTSRAGIYAVVLSVAKNESINAVDGSIIFNENATVVPSIGTSDSIISLWIHKPSVSGNSVNFSGIIPGGFSALYDQFGGTPSTEGKLFYIIFPFAKNFSSYTFTFDSTSLYLNDGHATKIMMPSKSVTLPASNNKNDFSKDMDITNTTVSSLSSSPNPLVIFIVSLIIFFIVCFYLTKKMYNYMHKL